MLVTSLHTVLVPSALRVTPTRVHLYNHLMLVIFLGNNSVACTESGDYCYFPFTYHGEIYHECTCDYWYRPWCNVNERGSWSNCVSCMGAQIDLTCAVSAESGNSNKILHTLKSVTGSGHLKYKKSS